MSALQLQSNSNEPVAISTEALEALQGAVRGVVIEPAHGDYDEARSVYNAMHDRRPGLIVQACDVADVAAAVRFAADHQLLLSVRGGGHSVPGFGTCDGGLVIDLGSMKGRRVDLERGSVFAEGGCTWGDVDHTTNAYGRATPGGVVSTTGIAGLTLGGGIGHLTRRCGLSCDNLRSAEVVTATGQILTCDETNHSDLFWALRGGGGNFGVVTSFELQLHAVDTIYGGPTFFEMDDAVAKKYQEMIREAPEELNAMLAFVLAPPAPFVPEAWHAKPVIGVLACWSGDEAEDAKIAEQMTGLGKVVGQALWRMPHPVINTLFDELLPKGIRHYWKANFVKTLSDEAIVGHLAHGAKTPSLESGTFLMPINGACHRRSQGEMAFGHRDVNFSTVIAGSWQDVKDDEANTAWVRDYYATLAPHSEAGGYINFMSGDDAERAPSNFGEGFARLREIKATYDPGNLFRMNQNIPPAD